MAATYWLARIPGLTLTTAKAATLVAVATTDTGIQAGYVDVSDIRITSSVADIGTAIINITVSPTSKILATTVNSSGTIGGALTDSGLLKVNVKGSTGDDLVRYIKLWTS